MYDLRARLWASLELDYMTKHDMLIEQAVADKGHRTAIRGIEWVLSKRFPKKYGNHGIDVNTQTNVVNIHELGLQLEVRKKILWSIRQRNENKANSG